MVIIMKVLFKKISLAVAVFALALAAGICGRQPVEAGAAVKGYTIGTSNVQVYSNTGLTNRYGAIYPSDEVTVNTVTSRYCKVTYPVARGRKTGYISTKKILTKTTGNNYTSKAKITTYRRAGGSTYGYVSKGDVVKVLGASGGYTQIKYPVSGGYKYAFIKTADLNAHVLPAASNTGIIKNGTYKLVSALNSNYVMDVNGASVQNGANVQLYADNGSNAQKFTFTHQSDGYYTISNVNSKKMLDCSGAGRTNGTNIQQYQSNFSAAQRWKVTSAGNGYYTLTCKCNGLLVDVTGARTANGTNIQMHSANRSAAQKWKLVPTATSSKPGNSDIGRKIVDYELSQVGIGDFRGNNRVIYNDWFYKRPVSGPGYAWCMVFQSYCAEKMGILGTGIPRTASCREAVEWYRRNHRFKDSRYYGGNYTPKAGDLVFYYEKGSYCHVGMVTAPPINGYLQTVEGNCWQPNGNYTVARFTRNAKRTIHNSYVLGYGLLY